MLSDLIIDYSWWTVIPVVITGIAYAALLYTGKAASKLRPLTRVLLFLVRFVVVTLLGLLLLNPSVKTRNKIIEKPVVVAGIDNSASMAARVDEVVLSDSINAIVTAIKSQLDGDADVEVVLFGDRARAGGSQGFDDDISDYSEFFEYVNRNYSDLNMASIVMIADGLFNRGVDPVSALSAMRTPVYTLALGDTMAVPDILISDVRYNSVVYADDIFPVEVTLSANGYAGKNIFVRLYDGNKMLSSAKINIHSDDFTSTHTFRVTANTAGRKRYVVIADTIEGEQNTLNNKRDIFVNILNNRQNILIYAYAPHPDIGALRNSIEQNNNYTVEVAYSAAFKGSMSDYDLVILHQIPAMHYAGAGYLKEIQEKKIPVMYIIGESTNLPVFNRFSNSVDIISGMKNITDARFKYNDRFAGFSFSEDYQQQLAQLPPLFAPLGNYKVADNSEVMAFQDINDIATDFPLILFYNDMHSKECVIAGEGLWLWRIQSYLKYDNTSAFDQLIRKSVMMLLAGNDNRKFRVITEGKYYDNEDIILRAELYNEAYEAVNTAAVSLKITDSDGLDYDYQFVPSADGYTAKPGSLPVGVYSYRAVAEQGKDNLVETGEFVVDHIDLEGRTVVADHRMLHRISSLNNGGLYYPDEYEDLINVVKNNPEMVSKVHYEYSYTSIVTWLPVLLLIVVLLGTEWFVRKYGGSY